MSKLYRFRNTRNSGWSTSFGKTGAGGIIFDTPKSQRPVWYRRFWNRGRLFTLRLFCDLWTAKRCEGLMSQVRCQKCGTHRSSTIIRTQSSTGKVLLCGLCYERRFGQLVPPRVKVPDPVEPAPQISWRERVSS
jgi:hypothetical protein